MPILLAIIIEKVVEKLQTGSLISNRIEGSKTSSDVVWVIDLRKDDLSCLALPTEH